MSANDDRMEPLEFELGEYLEKRMSAADPTDIQAIDEEIWKRYWAWLGVLYTDLSGFSRSVYDNGILYTLEVIFSFRVMAAPVIEKHGGIIAKTEGDSLIVLFSNAADALDTALEIRNTLSAFNTGNEHRKIFNACGIGYGRILNLGNRDMFGMEVNLASRLGEDIAQMDEILLTEAAKEEIEKTRRINTKPFVMDGQMGLTAYRMDFETPEHENLTEVEHEG